MVEAGYSTRAESITQFLTVFLVFLLVLALTYFTTRLVGSYQKTSGMMNKNFEALETYKICNGQFLQLVRIGDKYVVIAITKNSVNLICEMSKDEIDCSGEAMTASMTFKTMMENARKRFEKGGNQNGK